MNSDFDKGRRYQIGEMLELLTEIRKIDDAYRLRTILAVWERELEEALLPVLVGQIYVIKA